MLLKRAFLFLALASAVTFLGSCTCSCMGGGEPQNDFAPAQTKKFQ